MNRSTVRVAVVLAILSCASAYAEPKIVVTLDPIDHVTIALPQAINPVTGTTDAPSYDFGPNLQGALAQQMLSTHYILTERAPTESPRVAGTDSWDGSSVVPAATFKFTIDALTFRSGNRGDSMFYGFDERSHTPFNDGTLDHPNEFPLTLVQFQHWFDRTFQDRGSTPFDMYSGLDLGEGFTLNALVAWVDVKYATYVSEIRMHVEMNAPLVGRHEVKVIDVKGHGFYFDIVGGYEKWSGGIGLARTDAMNAAFHKAFAASYSVIDRWAKTLPLTAKLYGFASPDRIYLNTGINSQVPIGTRYVAASDPSMVFEVIEDAASSGSIARLVSGNPAELQNGMVLLDETSAIQAQPALARARAQGGLQPATPVAAETVNLPAENLPKSNFAVYGWNPKEDFWQAALDSITGTPLLSYRIWRYFQHDLSYQGAVSFTNDSAEDQALEPAYENLDLAEMVQKDAPSQNLPRGVQAWADDIKKEPWAKQIGLDVAPPMNEPGPIVAVIDSGVDYNHPALNQTIWRNPYPYTDPNGNTDLYGWDFISQDPRPYDDNYHGTEVASLVVGVAPRVRIMPLKVFNPFGITSSAAMYGAFQYAVDHGAKIIVAGWATQKPTQTFEMAVKYARDHGVLVIASAGDRGDDLSKNPEYPASLSRDYDNVLTVTGIDTQDQLVRVNGFYANYDPGTIALAAPGKDVLVAQPRDHLSRDTMTSLSAAIVAGAVARNWAATQGAGTYLDWIREIRAQAQPVAGLTNAVQGGLRLRVR